MRETLKKDYIINQKKKKIIIYTIWGLTLEPLKLKQGGETELIGKDASDPA